MGAYTELKVWQVAMGLVETVYGVTAHYPKEEIFGLTAQTRRSAISIPSNIAEGYGRDQAGYILQFLRIALGSTRELETQLLIGVRLKYVSVADSEAARSECDQVGKMLRGLIRSVGSKS